MAAQPYHTKWPDAAPQEGEELIFSISCGNSHLHWATHTGEDDGFNPQIFWRYVIFIGDIVSCLHNEIGNGMIPWCIITYSRDVNILLIVIVIHIILTISSHSHLIITFTSIYHCITTSIYHVVILARTPHLNKKEFQEEDQIAILSRNLPDDPHDYIFGHSVEATIEGAKAQSSKRAAPLISVYVVSTNTSQEILLSKIWNSIPCCRFFVMKGDDFFKKEEGRYDTMGNDRLATLTGAVHLHGHPALVFDGGTATTYSATDCRGNIMGGGIGPGIQCKLRSLADDTSALPEITTEEVIARVNQAQEMDHPLPTFARDTQEAMMADAFQEFAFKGKNVIQQWLEKAYNQAPMQREEGMKYNDKKMVCATGGDGDILMQLLQPNFGGVIEHFNTSDGSSKSKYQVENSKHLIHYGISCVLAAQKDSPRSTYLGKRVAKHFEVEADDGDNIFRGVVAKVIPTEEDGSFDFRIHYDDGDKEDVSQEELLGELY